MKQFRKGTPAFGVAVGLLLVIIAALMMTIGFWKTLLLLVLFGVGYVLGAVDDLGSFFKTAANRVIPEKKPEIIDVKKEITREQAEQIAALKEETAKVAPEVPEKAPQAADRESENRE